VEGGLLRATATEVAGAVGPHSQWVVGVVGPHSQGQGSDAPLRGTLANCHSTVSQLSVNCQSTVSKLSANLPEVVKEPHKARLRWTSPCRMRGRGWENRATDPWSLVKRRRGGEEKGQLEGAWGKTAFFVCKDWCKGERGCDRSECDAYLGRFEC
jgi:hypothetical protein